MRKSLWLALSALLSTGMVQAEVALPSMKSPVPSRQAVVKMGYQKFEKWCEQNAKEHMGSIQYQDIHAYYAESVSAVNEEKVSRLPAPDRERLTQTLKDVKSWASDRLQAKRLHSGGGTIYGYASASLLQDLADLKGECVDRWADNGTQKEPKVPTFSDLAKKPVYRGEDSAEYAQVSSHEKSSMANALKSAAGLPPGPRAAIWAFMKKYAQGVEPSSR